MSKEKQCSSPGCETKTNNADGVCSVCRVHQKANQKPTSPAQQKVGGRNPTGFKTCPCGRDFKPTGNRQIYCPDCSPELKAKRGETKRDLKKKPGYIVVEQEKTVATPAPANKAAAALVTHLREARALYDALVVLRQYDSSVVIPSEASIFLEPTA